MNNKKCNHYIQVAGEWVDDPDHDPVEYDLGGFDNGPMMWKDGGMEKTVDSHGKCSQCGEKV